MTDYEQKYYDRDGKSISFERYLELFQDGKYKIVKQETLYNCFLSTVWLGINHSFSINKDILIFETMIFCDDEDNDIHLEQWRYSTEKEAIDGHEEAKVFIEKNYMIKKDIDFYLALNWTYTIEEESCGGHDYYVIRVNELPGVCTNSDTIKDCMVDIKEAIKAAIKLYIKNGDPIPEPIKCLL